MARREIGGWLSGPPLPAGDPPGVRLGLPEVGPGSVASTGSRLGAFIIDAIVANLVAGVPYLVGMRYTPASRNIAVFVAFLAVEFIFDAIYGQTLGKRIFNIRVIRADGDGLASPGWLLLRTALLGFLIPAVVWDRDRRGLHDKAAGTVVVVDPNKAHTSQKKPAQSAKLPVKAGAVNNAKAPGPARQPKKTELNAARKKKRR